VDAIYIRRFSQKYEKIFDFRNSDIWFRFYRRDIEEYVLAPQISEYWPENSLCSLTSKHDMIRPFRRREVTDCKWIRRPTDNPQGSTERPREFQLGDWGCLDFCEYSAYELFLDPQGHNFYGIVKMPGMSDQPDRWPVYYISCDNGWDRCVGNLRGYCEKL
jgi:hypothetical protein